MSNWDPDDLARIEAADELQIASRREDGTLNRPRTIWVVRHGDDLYVRSVNGRTSAWYRATRARHEGHIRAGGVEADVTFVDTGDAIADELDTAYRTKYHRYAAYIVDSVLSPTARDTTLKLVPLR